MANLRTNNLSGEQGRNAYRGSVHFPQVHNSTDYLTIGSAGDFNFLHNGTSDWTAEFWVHPKQNNNRQNRWKFRFKSKLNFISSLEALQNDNLYPLLFPLVLIFHL